MSTQEYLWFLAFDDSYSFELVCQMLNEQGSFAGSEFESFECPDGRKRHAIQCLYDIVAQVKETDRMKGEKLKLKFYVLRKRLPDSAVEFWPPDWKSAHLRRQGRVKGKPAEIMTAAEFERKKQENAKPKLPYPPPVEDNDPSPFD